MNANSNTSTKTISSRPAPIDRESVQESIRRVGEAARAAHARGICVVPPRTHVQDAKKKRPIGDWKKHQTERPSAEMIAGWYGPNYGLGFVCGAISGNLECFEFDDRDAYDRFLSAAAEVGLAGLTNRVASGYEEESPSGGIHWMFYCPEVRGNTKLAARPGPPDDKGRPTVKTLIETRGEGGYVVVAPSFGPVHPSGKPYRMVRGGVASIVTLTQAERDSLWGLARTFDEIHPESEADTAAGERGKANARAGSRGLVGGGGNGTPGTPATPGILRPGDDFAARTSWAEILEPAGWRKSFERDGTTYWTRPGKSPTSGHSATTGHGGGDCLHVFSSSTEFEPGKSYTKFAAFCVLSHGGDMTAGARALGEMGFGGGPGAGVGVGAGPEGNRHHANGHQGNGHQDNVTTTATPAPSIITPAIVRAQAEAILVTGKIEALYLASEFQANLAVLEIESPGEAEAIKALVGRMGDYRDGAFRNAMKPHREAAKQQAAAQVIQGADPDKDQPTYEFTDRGNALRLIARYGHRLRYCKAYGEWLIYDGRRWAQDDKLVIEEMAKEVPGLVLVEMPPSKDPAVIGPYQKWSTASQAKERLTAMLHVARSSVAIVPKELDRSPWLLNVQNGTIDLAAPGGHDFREHRADDLITKLAPVAYDPAATCPVWERFILEIMDDDEDLADYLQRALGYSITGVVREHVFFFLYGIGRNGKTTLLKRLFILLGDYANEVDSDLFIAQHYTQHPTALTELEGRRLVMSDESDDGRRLAEAMVKKLTGGNPIQARRMHKDNYTFLPNHHLFFAANHKPEIRGTDPGIWGRIKLIPFNVSFDPKVPGGRTPDLELDSKLAAEAPGILNWLICGCRMWQERGLVEPPCLREVIADYRQEMDILGWFITDCCAIDKVCRVLLSSLYGAYIAWCEQSHTAAMSIRKFSSQLGDKGFVTEKSNSKVFKSGLRLKTEFELRFDQEDQGVCAGKSGSF